MNIHPKIIQKIAVTLLLMGITIGLSCGPTAPTQAPPREKEHPQVDTFAVFITGNTLGELKPCGCSGGQLGGFDRRSAVFNSVPAEKRLILDTGALVRSDVRQDLIKFNISIQALSILDYNVLNLTRKDVEISRNLGLLDDPVLGIISPYAADDKISMRYQSQYFLNGEPVTVCVVSYDIDTSRIGQIRSSFGPGNPNEKRIHILLVNRCNDAIITSIAKLGIVDCIICPAVSDEPGIMGKWVANPLVMSVGRFGRYIGKLQIQATQGKDDFDFSFETIAVKEELKPDTSLVSLYKDYQHLVKEANLLDEHPRFILPNGLKYVGSKSCASCHAYEYETWSSKAHASAFATLERVGSNFDPECVICHVVGMDYQSGFITQDKTPQLKDVGCENCHGPGSEHVKTGDKTKLTQHKSACTTCHTPEHSGEYAGNEGIFRQKIIHWTEQNASNSVQ